MSKYRVKSVEYDEDEDYDSQEEGPGDEEYLEECTSEVLNQLRSGDPSITTATRKEVQETLWHYYNDVDKSVRYLRSMSQKWEEKKKKKKKRCHGANVPHRSKDERGQKEAANLCRPCTETIW